MNTEHNRFGIFTGIYSAEEKMPGVVNQWFPIIDKINNNQ